MLDEFADIVEGKSVAIVGNALSLLNGLIPHGTEIDSHDIIVRMNMGIPGTHFRPGIHLTPERVGSRTDVWATAKYFGIEPTCKLGIFMKLTELGDKHWGYFQEKRRKTFPLVRWPQELETEVRDFVGADPGTGIRLVYFLKRHSAAKSISVFGMDCWDTLSNWSLKPNTPNHVPQLEKQALSSLLREA